MKTQPDPPLANQPPSPKPAVKPQAERQDKKPKDDGGGENAQSLKRKNPKQTPFVCTPCSGSIVVALDYGHEAYAIYPLSTQFVTISNPFSSFSKADNFLVELKACKWRFYV
jgi:hypothetical protein